MKICNYIFGKVTDPYSHIEKIKGLLELPAERVNSKWRATNFVQSCVRRYEEQVEEKSYKIKNDVHAALREDFSPSERNTTEELLFINRYLYFEHSTEKNLLVCRKKIKRRFGVNSYFHNINKSLHHLKREGYVSRETSEVVAVFPANCFIKFFCTKGNRFSAFVIERSDCYVNWGYVFRGSWLVRDSDLDHFAGAAASEGGPSPRGGGRRDSLRGYRAVQRLPRSGAPPLAGHSNRPRCCLLYHGEGVQNIAFMQTRRCKDGPAGHFSPPDFLTTELDEKHRCSRLFLNSCRCLPPRKKLLLLEADEKNFLSIYLSKDTKRIFLLSGNHHTNRLFLIQCKDAPRKGTPHYELRLIRLVGQPLLRGKFFPEHFRHHVVLLRKGDNLTEVYSLPCDALHLHAGQLGRAKKRGRERVFFPTHSVVVTREEVPIDGRLRRMVALQNCTLHDFDMTRYGLVLYAYRYFLKPLLCLLYLFSKRGRHHGRGEVDSSSPNIASTPSTASTPAKESRLVAKMKILSVPIAKGSLQGGLNSRFQSHLISVYICNPFVSSTRVVVDLRRGAVALPRNVQGGQPPRGGNEKKEENEENEEYPQNVANPQNMTKLTKMTNPQSDPFFRAKNNLRYDRELEGIFAKNKNYQIRDLFIPTQEGGELPVTLIYRRRRNGNLYHNEKDHYKGFSKHVEEESASFTVSATSWGDLCVHFSSPPRWSLDVGVQVEEHLPLFIKPSKTIINVYPFYRQLNICSYSDEFHFLLLSNFILVYFHLTGSGGLQEGIRSPLYRDTACNKLRTIRDLTDSINCLKHLNVSETDSMTIHLHSNSGLLGGFLLNGQRKFLQNVILVNPMMDHFNNLTEETNAHVHSERLEFGRIDPAAFLLRGGRAAPPTGLSQRGGGTSHQSGETPQQRGGTPPGGKHRQPRVGKRRRFVPLPRRGACQTNLLLLRALCPYSNVDPSCSEVFSPTKQPNQRIPFTLSVTPQRDNLFASAVLLYLNKYDVICKNANAVKYFLKYLHYERVHVRFCYYSFGFDSVGGRVNFLNFHSGEPPGEGQKQPLYISFSDRGGHGGLADYDSLLRRTLGRIHFLQRGSGVGSGMKSYDAV
ncbi:conserved Plasmodium protein, unknown function [Plasmodium vivax]|uniref:Uncharacterized protein n=1 Tax=Plasmodium vivax TaxID=5855 RepID=A0A564ZN69_PLAVI|nr:conserved Plasmodium protein, unknown function [Plasmodium vivax]